MITLFKDPFYDVFDRLFETPRYESLPKVKVTQKDKEYKLLMSVPGLSKNDLKITTDNGTLKISYEKEEKNENSYFLNSFTKSYSIPDDVNDADIGAKVENGILELTLPITTKKLTERMIEIF